MSWLEDAQRLDVAVYAAIARTPSPSLDRAMSRLSRAADYSRLSLASAAALVAFGGREGRRAAVSGLASVAATSAIVNLVLKPVSRRRRPDRIAQDVPVARHVRMPVSRSFPSGHAAAAFAFAYGVGRVSPRRRPPASRSRDRGGLLPGPYRCALSRRRDRGSADRGHARGGHGTGAGTVKIIARRTLIARE